MQVQCDQGLRNWPGDTTDAKESRRVPKPQALIDFQPQQPQVPKPHARQRLKTVGIRTEIRTTYCSYPVFGSNGGGGRFPCRECLGVGTCQDYFRLNSHLQLQSSSSSGYPPQRHSRSLSIALYKEPNAFFVQLFLWTADSRIAVMASRRNAQSTPAEISLAHLKNCLVNLPASLVSLLVNVNTVSHWSFNLLGARY